MMGLHIKLWLEVQQPGLNTDLDMDRFQVHSSMKQGLLQIELELLNW
jgi:hypothetical protein